MIISANTWPKNIQTAEDAQLLGATLLAAQLTDNSSADLAQRN
jgi:hypothetical protein